MRTQLNQKKTWALQYTKKKISFINRLKCAEQKIFCICVEVYKTYEGNDFEEIYEVLPTLKNKKLKSNIILIEKYKDMLENPDFEQDYYSRTAEGIYKIGHYSVRLMKWLAYYDRSYYEIINYYDMMGSILKSSNEISYVEVKDHRYRVHPTENVILRKRDPPKSLRT